MRCIDIVYQHGQAFFMKPKGSFGLNLLLYNNYMKGVRQIMYHSLRTLRCEIVQTLYNALPLSELHRSPPKLRLCHANTVEAKEKEKGNS